MTEVARYCSRTEVADSLPVLPGRCGGGEVGELTVAS